LNDPTGTNDEQERSTEARLAEQRPQPQPAYRERLARWIELRQRFVPARSTQRALAVALAIIGSILLVLAVLGVANAGPLG
jgi:hypothetical protein